MLQAYAELRQVFTLLDVAEKWLEKQLGVPTCIPNCGLCCQQNINTCHTIEANYILSGMIGVGLTKYIDASRAWLLDRHSEATIYEGIPRGVVTGKLKEEFNLLSHHPCIFYQPDVKRCAVHHFRPMSCRAFGVTRAPGLYCPRPPGINEDAQSRAYVGDEAGLLIRRAVEGFVERLKKRNPDWATHGFVPTMIFRSAREKEFRGLIDDNRIASAKLVGTDYPIEALWQEDVDAQWGMSDPTRNLIRA